MGRFARCSHLPHPRVSELGLDHLLDPARRPNRRPRLGGLREDNRLGRPQQTERMETRRRARVGAGAAGLVSIRFPQLLGNGKDIADLAFRDDIATPLLLALLLLKPAATVLCLGSGAPGGLFTPSLALGALLGDVLGHAWSRFWPGVPPGLFASSARRP
jgi:hypothetical protein